MDKNQRCPICGDVTSLLDVMDLNKSCGANGESLPLAGIPVYYALCDGCDFCFAAELLTWELEKFEEHIYNAEYALVDPDYLEKRPRQNASSLVSMFGDHSGVITHLDFGGGDGRLTRLLHESNWQSTSYDPFVDKSTRISQMGKFDLITAFEVFEHVPDVRQLMSQLATLLAKDGLVLFSTLLSDGNIHRKQRLNWWYASPRNGHISLFSRKSLALLARQCGFNFASFSEGFHVFYNDVPPWASHIIRTG